MNLILAGSICKVTFHWQRENNRLKLLKGLFATSDNSIVEECLYLSIVLSVTKLISWHYPFKNYLLNARWENIHRGPSNPGWFSWICQFIFFLFYKVPNFAIRGLEKKCGKHDTISLKLLRYLCVLTSPPVLLLVIRYVLHVHSTLRLASVVVTSNHHKRHDVRMVARTHPMLCRGGERGGCDTHAVWGVGIG